MLFKFIVCVLWIFKITYIFFTYLINVGYPNEYEYVGLYKDESYHFQDIWPRGQPTIQEEQFNHVHSSLRNIIDRAFIV
jgi:hypothetical protein